MNFVNLLCLFSFSGIANITAGWGNSGRHVINPLGRQPRNDKNDYLMGVHKQTPDSSGCCRTNLTRKMNI